MSRVRVGQKFVNISKGDLRCNPSKVIRIKGENSNYKKARTLTDWLFLKYDMSYTTYRNKSKSKRESLRKEYENDTGQYIDIIKI